MKYAIYCALFAIVALGAVVGCEAINAWWETPGVSGNLPAQDLGELPIAVATQNWPRVIAIVGSVGVGLAAALLGAKKYKQRRDVIKGTANAIATEIVKKTGADESGNTT